MLALKVTPKPEEPKPPKPKQLQTHQTNISAILVQYTKIDICEISVNALHFNIRHSSTEFFCISLYEIDWIIDKCITDKYNNYNKDEET